MLRPHRLLLLPLALACAGEAPPPPAPVPVVVAVAERRPMPFVLEGTGVVEPLQSVAVEAQVGGQLTRVGFREGDDVAVGQVLFELDRAPYAAALEQARATLARSRFEAENARREVERSRELVAKDYVTRQQFEQLETTAAALGAAVAAAEAALRRAELNLEWATIRAPIAGRTGQLLVKPGNLVRTGLGEQPLVVINQLRPILVRFALPAASLAAVRQHLRAAPAVRATPAGAATAALGRLTFVDNAVDTATGTIQLKGEFANADGALWPGQFVAVRLELFVEQDALVVPSQAVVTGQQGPYVFVVDSAGTAALRPVTVARTQDGLAVVTAGIAAGDRVVTDGQLRLRPGVRVAARAAAADSATAGAR